MPWFRLLCVLACLSAVPAWGVDVESKLDVEYGVADGQSLKLDMFVPQAEGGKLRPAVIYVHGGGWQGGDKKDFNKGAAGLAQVGYVTFSINYRLVTDKTNKWPAQLDDTQRAVRWVRAHAQEYQIDPERIGAVGGSAGGHLVTYLGTTETRDNSDKQLAKYSSRVQCVINIFGPTDLADDFAPKVKQGALVNELVKKLLGGTPADKPEAAKSASPLLNVDKTAAPFLIFHGTEDPLVPVDHSERLDAALKKVGAQSKLIVYQGEGHGFQKPENVQSFIKESVDFLKLHLQP